MEDMSLPVNYSYIIGLYLAVNAVPDLFMYMDGPDCATFKAEFLYGRHDLNSTLLDCAGPDRIVRPRNVDATSIVHDRTDEIRRILLETCSLPEAGGVMFASMPMATITGTQYDSIVRTMGDTLPGPIFEVPSLSLSSDWLDGYACVMESLATGLELKGTPDPGKVAVVGYFMDRNERDHTANITELENMLRGIGLDPVSIWLSGRPLSHLQCAGEAGMVISLPHGRAAARTIAGRTGAKLVETDVPFGFRGSANWLATVAKAAGREKEAAEYTDSELRRLLPGLEWTVNRIFLGTRFIFGGDPHMMEPMRNLFAELGCRPAAMFAVAEEKHLTPLPKSLVEDGVPCRFNMKMTELGEMADSLSREGFDILVAQDTVMQFFDRGGSKFSVIPFGFSNYSYHALSDSPFIGFEGALHFIDRVANGIMSTKSG